jgi:hypothetical protein
MPQFTARGDVALSDVTFFIEADDEEEARAKAEAGEYDFYEIDGAETVDWTIRSRTVEPDE